MKHKWFIVLVAIGLLLATFTVAQALKPNPNCPSIDTHKGRVITVPKGCRVVGDVLVARPGTNNWRIQPDTDPETGMIVQFNKAGKVWFKYGNGSVTGQLLEPLILNQAKDGCENGCSHGTNVLEWPQSAQN